MRLITVFALVQLLLVVSPVVAQITGEDMDSEHQTTQYGHIFGGVLLAAGGLTAVLVIYHVIKGIKAEHSRGKKTFEMREEILDKKGKKDEGEPQVKFMGERVPDWKIANRQKATRAALKFLACTDKRFGFTFIVRSTAESFMKVKTALEDRTAKPVVEYVTADYIRKMQEEINKLRKKGEYHVFGNMEVTDVVPVYFEAPVGKNKHRLTVLITAKSKDYIKDDKTGEVLRGDKKFYTYQEFWCFKRSKNKWLVDRVRPAGDMDRILAEKNVMAKIDLQEFGKDAEDAYMREFTAV